MKWLGEARDAFVYFLIAAYHEDEHVKLVFESCLFIFLPSLQPGVTDQAFQVKWVFSEPVFFWKGLVNYLILEAETALTVLYITRLNASRAFCIQLMHKGNIRANVPSVL